MNIMKLMLGLRNAFIADRLLLLVALAPKAHIKSMCLVEDNLYFGFKSLSDTYCKAYLIMKGYTDTPVLDRAHDVMGVDVYVESLSEFILDCSTPMTIAIQGDWGSGKTSIMNMIKNEVEKKVIPVWFNTWQYSQFEMASYLPISLLGNFLEKIGAQEESKTLLKNITQGAMNFTKAAAVIAAEKVVGETIAGNLNESLFSDNKRDLVKTLEELKERIYSAVKNKLTTSGKNRIVVFVDDLDRLQPEKAVELLEVLKVFMDVPDCVFVLAVDYSIVTQGLEKKFGSSIGHSKGKSFFDKIIQLPFFIPIAQYNISAYIDNLLSNIDIKCSNEEIQIYQKLVDFSVGCNPRSMKRLFNSFILLNKVALKKDMFNESDKIRSQDKRRILFAILCLQTAFHEIYELMIKNKNVLSMDFIENLKDSEQLKNSKDFEQMRESVSESNLDVYCNNIARFMSIFHEAINLDSNSDSDDDEGRFGSEIKNLINILSFSAITSSSEERNVSFERDVNNREFWTYFLVEVKGKSILFQKISPSDSGWIASGCGVSGVAYVISVLKKSVRYSLSFNRPSKDENKKIFDALMASKTEIESSINKSFLWKRNDEKKGSTIDYEIHNVSIYDKEKWPEITQNLIQEINEMEEVFRKYLSAYKKT